MTIAIVMLGIVALIVIYQCGYMHGFDNGSDYKERMGR